MYQHVHELIHHHEVTATIINYGQHGWHFQTNRLKIFTSSNNFRLQLRYVTILFPNK